jgi:hypothetical protein
VRRACPSQQPFAIYPLFAIQRHSRSSPGAKATAMTAWIIGLAIFYTFAIAYLGYEMRRAPLVDENGNLLSDDNRAPEALHTMPFRHLKN